MQKDKLKTRRRGRIGLKIAAVTLPLMIVSVLALTIIFYATTRNEMLRLSSGLLNQIATDTATLVQKEIRGNAQLSDDIAQSIAAKGYRDKKDILEELRRQEENAGFKALGFADKTGAYTDTQGNTADIGSTEYFQMAIGGTRAASEIYVSPIDGQIEIAYCAPITTDTGIIGVVVAINDGMEYCNITNALDIGYEGSAFIIERDSKQVLASANEDFVTGLKTIPQIASEDKEYASFCNAAEEMIENISGITDYVDKGEKKIVVYTGMLSDYWIIGVEISENQIMKGVRTLGIYATLIALGMILVAVVIIMFITRDIDKGFLKLKSVIDKIAKGNFSETVDEKLKKRSDEIGDIAENMENINTSLSGMVSNVKDVIDNVDGASNKLNDIVNVLNENNNNIATVVTEVAKDNSSQARELGKITQRLNAFNTLLDDMNGCILSIKDVGNDISRNAGQSRNNMSSVTETVGTITEKFETLVNIIEKMQEKLVEITNITDMIENISNKTNLLSLNASIESARAGEAGKGFSVVASEIGKLALESSESTREIRDMIKEAIGEMEILTSESNEINGYIQEQNKSICDAVEVFTSIAASVDVIQPIIEEVTEKSKLVEHDKTEILEAVDSIVATSEQVAASAEEIAATTEEVNQLSNGVAQSSNSLVDLTKQMQEQINQFQ